MSLREWKKVYQNDLINIVSEFRDSITKPAMIILSGPLGSGKTTFTKSFSDIKSQETTSPTYSIIQELGRVAHADLYRIENSEEMIHLEIPLYLEGKDYFLVEWGKQYEDSLNREVPDHFSFYELVIEVNSPAATDLDEPSRNYLLKELER